MIGLLISLAAAASGASASYGENLLDAMHKRHPHVTRAQVTVANGQGPAIALDRRWMDLSRSTAKRPLFDANGNEIGALTLHSRCARISDAEEIESELSRRIYSPGSLADPDPFGGGAVRAPTGQGMIDAALDRDPGIITLAFHVTPPGAATNMIVASSFGRIGKPGDADDERVIREGKTLREVTNSGKRVAMELPLLDVQGRVIGALSASFKLEPGTDADQLEKRAILLRDSLARRTPSLKALFRPATVSRQVGGLRTCHS
jgi:hypothetical protein